MIDSKYFGNNEFLYFLHDMFEEEIEQCKLLLSRCKPQEFDKIKELEDKIAYYTYQIIDLEKNVNSEEFKFSIEELYSICGQYDKFIGIEFHKLSESAQKYPRYIGGTLIYTKSEREKLDLIIQSEEIPRTNDFVKIDVTSNYNLSTEQNNQLLYKGFKSGDIFKISLSNMPAVKSFKQEGMKEIPNTINITFDATDFDGDSAMVNLALNKIKDGYKLLEHEYIDLYSKLIVLNSEIVNEKAKNKYLFKKDKIEFTEEALIIILSTKYRRDLINNEEILKLLKLLKDRRHERFNIIKRELGVGDKQIELFKKEHPDKYDELLNVTISFETETLTHYKSDYPIYWDFHRFIHIYLRHYKNFFIRHSTTKGTQFQYSYKDIKRIVGIVIEKLKDDIEADLSMGRPYAKYGDKGYYYNGNFYTIRIDKSGRLMQFHPIEEK